MSNTEHKRCQRLILISPFPNSAWAFPELACSLDKFSVELGGWERAGAVRVLQCVQQFSREHILLWLPCRSHCQRSGELPSHEQMPSCAREGLAWSLLSAAIPLKQVLIQLRRHWVQLCVAKKPQLSRQFQWIKSKHSLGLASCLQNTLHVPHTMQLSVSEISDRMGNSGLSMLLGIKLEILHSALCNSCVTWGSWRRLLVWIGLSSHEEKKKKVQFLLLWNATELVTQKQVKHVGCTRWRQPEYPPAASFNELISEVVTRMIFYGSKLLGKKLSASPAEQKCLWATYSLLSC